MVRKKSKKRNQISKGTEQLGAINYPVGDFLVRIKNAKLAHKRIIHVRSIKLIKGVAKVLQRLGYLDETKEKDGRLEVSLTYRKKEPVLIDLKIISKPGLRVYMSVDELEKVRGPSTFIISTPKGIMTSKEAIKKRLGGEVIVEVY
jgi:small subunit ribosomal protein S8